MENTGLYVHIPFCLQKCHYCDFPSYPLRHLAADYLTALARDAQQYSHAKIQAATVFIGGGTPTCLTAEELERLLTLLHRSFFIPGHAEFTVEANPGTITADKLRVLKKHGANRLSIGAQAFQPAMLARLGRIHSVEDIYRGFAAAREQGFHNINLDLMSGLPGQAPGQWAETLQKAVELGPEHIAAYCLKVEEGTLFHQQQSAGRLPLPDEDADAAMTELTRSMLQDAGFRQYEISNYAKPGFPSKHNLRYWHNETYIGIGCAAWSYRDGVRRGNITDVAEYISRALNGERLTVEQECPGRTQAMFETMMLGLRLIEGVSRSKFTGRYGTDPLDIYGEAVDKLRKLRLLDVDGDRIFLTPKGLLLSNEAIAEFL